MSNSRFPGASRDPWLGCVELRRGSYCLTSDRKLVRWERIDPGFSPGKRLPNACGRPEGRLGSERLPLTALRRHPALRGRGGVPRADPRPDAAGKATFG